VCALAAPNVTSRRGTEDIVVGVRKDMVFEVEIPFAETGSARLLAGMLGHCETTAVGEPLCSALCLPRLCRVQGVCMGSAQCVRNLQGTLGAVVVDGCPTSSRPPPHPPPLAARELEACAQLPSSSASVGVRFHLHCYFAVKK